MSEADSTNRRYLALWFPLLPADRRRRLCGPDDAPVAFIEKQRGAMRIVALDARALKLGLAPGLTLADARARVPELLGIDHDPYGDRLWLERIADGCDRWTPMVALDSQDGVTLDITGCLQGYASSPSIHAEDSLAADVTRRLTEAGMTLRLAFANSPEAAQALVRYQSLPAAAEAGAIRRLPIVALRIEEEAETALRRAGLKTIGDLADRPPAPLAARFGAELVAALDRMLGRADSRISPRRALPAIVCERRFAEPIARTDDALGVLDELVREAVIALEERHGGGRRFVGRLYRSDGVVREIAIETGLPTRDPKVPARLFRERIDTLADPIDPGFGFDMIRLAVPAIEPLAATQLRLEGGRIAEEAMAALVDRLSTRLGRDRVRRFAPRATHIPEQQALVLPAVALPDPAAWQMPPPGEPPLRPLHLFDPPQKIEVIAEVPDGPPRRFRWRRTSHEVARFEGPERIAGEWWRVRVDRLPDPGPSTAQPAPGRDAMDCDAAERADPVLPPRPAKPLLTRDYFRVEDVRGRRFWLFRHGLYENETASPDWYLHGLFA
ncbi:Y-family DNA polymerase [Sphingomonas abietis]|uniref:DNA polymerase Y family protein n=1 Tax=Sphingomonas abietis TaxID=3012344 RepID=A0ABY7NP04_9SPHN|nr:DNA polymerase Y family protein [Sphingomonas abietis]WBO23258.1 DNA polymerase Y family protein [Sphingomonas abietis]